MMLERSRFMASSECIATFGRYALCALICITFFLSPAYATDTAGRSVSEGEDLRAMYEAAIVDAMTAEAHEIYDGLIAVVEDNEYLLFRGEPGNRQVLMVTWTSWTGYDDYVGKSLPMDTVTKANMPQTRDVWVTAAPEVRDFSCTLTGQSAEAIVLRLEQRLGLPPGNGKTRFVEMWVNTEDLFRPTPDPDITDTVAGLDFPPDTSQEYMDWFEALRAESYSLEHGYPWTRLGYTYDWGSPDSVVGFSEFVIRSGAIVDVHAVIMTADYCENGAQYDEIHRHSADYTGDNHINLEELLRVIQFYNSGGYHCAEPPESSEDGYTSGADSAQHACVPHASDYNPQNWHITLSELLRLVQFYNSTGYYHCPEQSSEDGFCAGLASG